MKELLSQLKQLSDFEDQKLIDVLIQLVDGWRCQDKKTDMEIEKFIAHLIRGVHPSCGILSEENYHDYAQTQCSTFFLVDPIDGSHNRLRGLPYFSVSICKYQNGAVVSAAVYIPHWNVVYLADLRNAFRVSSLKSEKLKSSVYRSKSSRYISMFKRDLIKFQTVEEKIRTISCSSIELCLLAQGSLDAFIDRIGYEKECDVAAALFILSRAGGVFEYGDWTEVVSLPTVEWMKPKRLIAASNRECLSEYRDS